MSKCMTIADESIDQKDTCTEIAPKEIVEFVLEEILLSALIISDKGDSRIGDFNISEDFCQQYDRQQYPRDFEQVNHTGSPSLTNQESTGKSTDRPAGLVTAKENLELIIDSFVKKEGVSKPGVECTIISEEVLADNELQIQNGQSHIENNSRGRCFEEAAAREYFDKKDVIKDEKIEIEYYNEGKLTKIYVPLIPSSRLDIEDPLGSQQVQEKREEAEQREEEEIASGQMNGEEDTERPFQPFTSEEFRQARVSLGSGDSITSKTVAAHETCERIVRFPKSPRALEYFFLRSILQVWENINSSLVGRWDGDVSAKREEVGTLMEKLSSVQVFSDASVDPNRPRACAFEEEDVKKIIREIEEISFTQSHANSEVLDLAYHPDGQGDADLESRSFIRSIESLGKEQEVDEPQEDGQQCADKSDNSKKEEGILTSDNSIFDRSLNFSSEMCIPEAQKWTPSGLRISPCGTYTVTSPGSNHPKDGEQHKDMSSEQDGGAIRDLDPVFNVDLPPGGVSPTSEVLLGSSSYSHNFKEGVQNTTVLKDPPFWNPANENNVEAASEIDPSPPPVFDIHFLHPGTIFSDPKMAPHSAEAILQQQQSANSVTPDSGNQSKEKSIYETENHLREPDPSSDWRSNYLDMYEGKEGVSDELQRNEKDFAGLERILLDIRRDSSDGEQSSKEVSEIGTSLTLNKAGESWIHKSVNDDEEPEQRDVSDPPPPYSSSVPPPYSASILSPPPAEDSAHSLTDSETFESTQPSRSTSQPFRLHSQKMYLGINHEPDSQMRQECTLTESEEAFIDETESVLQVIEPQEHSEDENPSKVSFSLLSEVYHEESFVVDDPEAETELLLTKNSSSESETKSKKIYSGMTTIGPMKNLDYDPKDLTIQNIDYGKMTRITSSRQLAKELDMFGPELTPAASIKIVEEDSDNDMSLNIEDDHVEFPSLVNRDIASLTKVQKVREVMSHQPKPEDDFEDDDALPRPRLDLKDVESMSDERYKVPDVSIPLLSLEIGDANIATEKELIENMGLVLSGLTNPVYYDQEDSFHSPKDPSVQDEDLILEFTDIPRKQTSKTKHEQISITSVHDEEDKHEQNQELPSQEDKFSNSPKCSTLGSVFRKASNKFIRKDSEPFLRNSKSLPRETTKITATDSLRSMFDDCQSSASNMLKKSKSLLKNTQSIFKSMSSSRVSSERDPGQNAEKKKLSPSESDVSTLERKLSSFLKREEFTKAKNLIKSKVEKTFKNSSTGGDKVSAENKDFQVAIRDEEKLRVDRMENFGKLLPKSPLVYKSQFVRSQTGVESGEVSWEEKGVEGEEQEVEEDWDIGRAEEREEIIAANERESQRQTSSEIKIPLQESQQWSDTDRQNLHSLMNEEFEPQQQQQLDYIVMETIQGLPTADLDSPSSEKENIRMETKEQEVERKTEDDDMKKMAASDSFQACAGGGNDVAPCFPELGEEKMATKTPSERKMKAKKKKLSARLRSFWSSAFGKVKTSPKKDDGS